MNAINQSNWSVDKRVSLPVLLVMMTYFVGGVSFLVYQNVRLSHIEVQITDSRPILDRITKIEENLKYHTNTLGRIERYLEKQ